MKLLSVRSAALRGTLLVTALSTATLLLTAPTAALAESTHDRQGMQDMPGMNTPATQPAEVITATGVVKNWGAEKVSIAHQAIPQLNWPPMTMQFSLQGYQGQVFAPGQRITFAFKQVTTGYQLVSASTN